MPFSDSDKQTLLAVNGIGPTVILRLEQLGFSTLPQLAQADVQEITASAAAMLQASCWKNSPQARAAIQAAIDTAKASMTH